jgi:hypothetical protein
LLKGSVLFSLILFCWAFVLFCWVVVKCQVMTHIGAHSSAPWQSRCEVLPGMRFLGEGKASSCWQFALYGGLEGTCDFGAGNTGEP